MTLEKQLFDIWDNVAVTRLFGTFRLAVGPSRIVIAFVALLAVSLTGWVMDSLTMSVVIDPRARAILAMSDYETSPPRTELDIYVVRGDRLPGFISAAGDDRDRRQGVFSTLWHFGAARFNEATVTLLRPDGSSVFHSIANIIQNMWLCVVALFWAVKYHTIYSIVFFGVVLVVGCFAGGALCRSVALDYSRAEKPGLIEVLSFSAEKFKDNLYAPLLPAAIMVVFAGFIYLLGLGSNIPTAGELFLGLGLAAALVCGLLTVLMLVGTIAGGSLMLPVIAWEGSDVYDAVSRSLRYVFSRPWWMLFYTSIAALCGIVSYLFVRLFAFLLLIVTYSVVELGAFNGIGGSAKLERIWPRPDFFLLPGSGAGPVGWSESVAALLVRGTVLFVIGLLVAFVISYYFSAAGVIYSLLRRKIDGVSLTRVYTKLDDIREFVDSPHATSGPEADQGGEYVVVEE